MPAHHQFSDPTNRTWLQTTYEVKFATSSEVAGCSEAMTAEIVSLTMPHGLEVSFDYVAEGMDTTPIRAIRIESAV